MGIRGLTVAVAAITMITLSGCGKIAEKASETATEKLSEQACKDNKPGEECDVDISKDGVKVKTGDGSFSAGGDTDYPDGYPDYLKADGFKPISAVSSGDGSVNVTLTGKTPGSALVKTLQGQAEAAGCTTDDATAATGGAIVTLNCSEGTVTLMGIGDTGAQQGANVTITPPPNGVAGFVRVWLRAAGR